MASAVRTRDFVFPLLHTLAPNSPRQHFVFLVLPPPPPPPLLLRMAYCITPLMDIDQRALEERRHKNATHVSRRTLGCFCLTFFFYYLESIDGTVTMSTNGG